jgi:hypothetical protein
MPAVVTVKYLGDAQKEAELSRLLEKTFEKLPGQWRVALIGDQGNTIWMLKVADSEGREVFTQQFDGQDGSHLPDRIRKGATDFIVGHFRWQISEEEKEAARLRSIGDIKDAQALESALTERKAILKEYDAV